MNRGIFLTAPLMIASATVMSSRAAPAPDHGSCLAGLCIEDRSATEPAVIRQLGHGTVGTGASGARTHCYIDARAGVWAEFGFEDHPSRWRRPTLNSIMLTTTPLCTPENQRSAPDLGRRLGGIALGWPEAAVVERLGQPFRVDDLKEVERRHHTVLAQRKRSDFGEIAYVYADPATLRFLFVFFEKGVVKTLWFAETE
jgi:hypothetical protein